MENMDDCLKMSVEELKAYSKTVTLQERLNIAVHIANHLNRLVVCMFPEAAQFITEGDLHTDLKSKEVSDTFLSRLMNQ